MSRPTPDLSYLKYILDEIKDIRYRSLYLNEYNYNEFIYEGVSVTFLQDRIVIRKNGSILFCLYVYEYGADFPKSQVSDGMWDLAFVDNEVCTELYYIDDETDEPAISLKYPFSEEEHFQYSLLYELPEYSEFDGAREMCKTAFKLMEDDILLSSSRYDVRISQHHTISSTWNLMETLTEIIKDVHKAVAKCPTH